MSDIYVPGIRSRFNTEQIVEDLMTIERIPRNRVQNNIDTLQLQKGYLQEVGRRVSSLGESARFLFSFQNPFHDRIVQSGDDSVITATANRQASEQTLRFSVKQTAQADRFLSQPLDERMRLEAGTYTFTVGNDEISIPFRGGTLRDFVDILNRRGRDKISASFISVQSGTRSLLIESRETGAGARLGFAGDAKDLALNIGMMQPNPGSEAQRSIPINENTVRGVSNTMINDGVLQVPVQTSASIPLNITVSDNSPLVLRLETRTNVDSNNAVIPGPPPGPSVPSGSVTFGGITIQNEPSSAPTPAWQAPPVPVRNDDMSVLTLAFSDGTSVKLPAISDSGNFVPRQYDLADFARGKTIVSLNVENANTHREVLIGNAEILDPTATSDGLRPVNAVSTARDAIVSMEGLEISRSTNIIDDLIPGVTLNVRGVSERQIDLNVSANIPAVKDAIISFVGNYNRLMAELNILTRRDDSVIDDITYMSSDEASEMRERLGVFSTDSALVTLRNNLQRVITAPYPTHLERELTLLSQIGVSTNADRASGYDPSRLRGYLQINERELDAALETKITAIRELFANDTTGDLLADTGVAFNVDALIRPFSGSAGIISLKANAIDSRIGQDERRLVTIDRQLASKEQELRIQYARMEAAYAQMERMSSSLDNFSQQNRGGR
ncbi:MAG: flagellar filament capping protein FliD [Treponema sp.]|jgi:flagellar hook-associated protein 2|nr:flagellar filament capping protein FliD [Treponema sp.]